MLIRSAIGCLLLCLSCSATPPQADEACVSSCISVEPEHPADCEAACLAYEGDAALATADVKENCELTEDPPPVPTSTEKWLCDGVTRFLPGCLDSANNEVLEVTSPKSEAGGFAPNYQQACDAAKARSHRMAQGTLYSRCVIGGDVCSACAKTP